jgi:AraC family transcriptional regulator
MDLKTVERQPVRVACLRYTGPFGPAVGEFWGHHVQPWLTANQLNVSTYGIARDDHATTPSEKTRYDACAEVKPGFRGTGLYHLAIIPGGKYAVAAFKGTADAIGAAWGEVMSQALPASGLTFDTTRMPFEHYAKDFKADPETGGFVCELCVPIETQESPAA